MHHVQFRGYVDLDTLRNLLILAVSGGCRTLFDDLRKAGMPEREVLKLAVQMSEHYSDGLMNVDSVQLRLGGMFAEADEAGDSVSAERLSELSAARCLQTRIAKLREWGEDDLANMLALSPQVLRKLLAA